MPIPMRQAFAWLILLLVVLAGVGCGSATVTGNVTYDGKAIAKGKITFVGAEENGSAVGTDIDKGEYHIKEMSPGKKKVYILILAGHKENDLPVPAEGPTDLTADVARGRHEIDFPLKELKRLSLPKD
jgi:hypothetical protein